MQHQSGMKVCTDATLFAAMAPVNGGEKVLDIGTGTGVLSLIVAQLGAGQITAVELTRAACEEARLNFRNSPWAKSIEAVHKDIRSYPASTSEQFDLILCNPPFFLQHSKPLDGLRKLARHTDQLSHADLLACTDTLLSRNGLFYVLLPVHTIHRFVEVAAEQNLFLINRTNLKGYSRNRPKVAALLFSRTKGGCEERTLTIYQSDRVYAEESEQYLSAFLLRFAGQGSIEQGMNPT